MTKCSTLLPAIRQSGFITSVIYKTYIPKDLSHFRNVCCHTQIVFLPTVTRPARAHPAMVPRSGVGTSDHHCGNTSIQGTASREAGECQLWRLRGQVQRSRPPQLDHGDPEGRAAGRWAQSTQSRRGEGKGHRFDEELWCQHLTCRGFSAVWDRRWTGIRRSTLQMGL